MLQRARQEVGGSGSPSATERMLRYVMDRERSGVSEEEERARGTGWFRPSPSRGGNEEHRNPTSSRDSWQQPPPASDLRERDRQERVDAFRRGYLAENVPPRLPRISTPPVPSAQSQPRAMFLENTLKYLSELRSCTRYEEALSTAIDHGLATKEFFADKHDDFVMLLNETPPLPYSSWLQPGTVFEGHQHANNFNANLPHQAPMSTSRVEQINPNYRSTDASTTGFDHPLGSTRVVSFDTGRTFLSYPPLPHLSKEARQDDDHWPVRVVIHSIDPEKITLQGTMEAYDVPQHPSSLSDLNSSNRPKAGKKNAPITTYLEGHVIDLRTHSFLTPAQPSSKTGSRSTSVEHVNPHNPMLNSISFPSTSAATDVQNWLRLPPFSALADASTGTTGNANSAEDSIARALLSKSKLQAIHDEYIFMRWKERCFVHSKRDDNCAATEAERRGDQDRGHGLTISGFYYVSLRRADGAVEGLYYDPASSPLPVSPVDGKDRWLGYLGV